MELTGGPGPHGDDDPPAPPRRPWGAAATGASVGLLLATAGILAVELLGRRGTGGPAPRETATLVDLFRLPSGSSRELFVVPAGPDALGEPRLSKTLFPGETPARELASVVAANVGGGEAWQLDLGATPLRTRSGDGGWEPLEPVADRLRARGSVPADVELRLRGLGGAATSVRVEPGTLAQVLVALPPGRTVADLSDVQLGDVALVRDRLDLERVRRFRLDPAGTTSGR